MFITKMLLPRRTFLRGAGAVVALPLLEAMVPAMTAFAKTAAATPRRFGAIYIPHGAIMDQWTPATVGNGFEFKPILKPLEAFKDHTVIVSNLGQTGRREHQYAYRDRRRMAERGDCEADGRRGRLPRDDRRSDRREEDRPGHAVPVD